MEHQSIIMWPKSPYLTLETLYYNLAGIEKTLAEHTEARNSETLCWQGRLTRKEKKKLQWTRGIAKAQIRRLESALAQAVDLSACTMPLDPFTSSPPFTAYAPCMLDSKSLSHFLPYDFTPPPHTSSSAVHAIPRRFSDSVALTRSNTSLPPSESHPSLPSDDSSLYSQK
ncbi:hypothetical protein K470DRAFT_31606 [Piedraia hortae CBS 480.64]|uniref:Uncharacterized protein n=1 Tax=Piedraia hortae CBS 480.64 TaxID=1314780 RepID=A0A6A7C2Y0_9PEZI|nr:hypothetical protein K470DRAFT_31606 [Piedraia hortae CBS 480.64]